MPNLKQPEWRGKEPVVHASATDKMGRALCGTAVGRSWTVTAQKVTCRKCKENMRPEW